MYTVVQYSRYPYTWFDHYVRAVKLDLKLPEHISHQPYVRVVELDL